MTEQLRWSVLVTVAVSFRQFLWGSVLNMWKLEWWALHIRRQLVPIHHQKNRVWPFTPVSIQWATLTLWLLLTTLLIIFNLFYDLPLESLELLCLIATRLSPYHLCTSRCVVFLTLIASLHRLSTLSPTGCLILARIFISALHSKWVITCCQEHGLSVCRLTIFLDQTIATYSTDIVLDSRSSRHVIVCSITSHLFKTNN